MDDLAISEPVTDVFAALFDDPQEAARLRILADMSIQLEMYIRKTGWTQKEAARQLGVTQPRISDLMRGKLSVFSIDGLVGLLLKAGIAVEFQFKNAA